MNNNLKNEFEMTDLGLLHYFLGLHIWYMDDGIFLSQPNYATNLPSCFYMSDFKPSPTPFHSSVKLTIDCDTHFVASTLYHQVVATLYHHAVGILIYLTHIRPDLSFVVSMVSR